MSYRKNTRPDHIGTQAQSFKKNRKRIMYNNDVCAICGRYVDKSLKYPNPMSASVDHIIPISKGGNVSDINNLQLCHMVCNQKKSDKVLGLTKTEKIRKDNNKIYQTMDWKNF